MYENKPKWKEFELRQGDVLAGVPFPYSSILQQQIIAQFGPNGQADFPQLAAKMHALSPGSADESYFTGQLPMKLSFCAVITQCCELVCNSKGKLTFCPGSEHLPFDTAYREHEKYTGEASRDTDKSRYTERCGI